MEKELDKIYILISKHESADEKFTSAHKTLQGAIATMNEDYQENNDTDDLLYELSHGDQERVDGLGEINCDGGNVVYEITSSTLWD